MDILLYSHTFLPNIGGREIVVYYLGKSLTELGHNVRVVGPSGWFKLRKLNFQFPIHRYPRFIRGELQDPGLIARLKEKEMLFQLLLDKTLWGCDLIHAHTTYPTGYIASRTRRIFRKTPLIITPHGVDIDTIPALQYGMRLQPHLKSKIDNALANADAVTEISDGIKTSLLNAGVDQNKLYKITNGVDIDRFTNPVNCNVNEFFLNNIFI